MKGAQDIIACLSVIESTRATCYFLASFAGEHTFDTRQFLTGRSQKPSATPFAVRCCHAKNLQAFDHPGARRRYDHAR